jgi:hypothetical protein
LQYNLSDEERVILEELDRLIVPDVEFFDDVLSHLKYIGQCDYLITAPTLVRQLAGLANIPCLSWGVGGWSFLGQRQYPWFPSVAVIEANFNHDKGALVHRLSKWLNIALEHHDDE